MNQVEKLLVNRTVEREKEAAALLEETRRRLKYILEEEPEKLTVEITYEFSCPIVRWQGYRVICNKEHVELYRPDYGISHRVMDKNDLTKALDDDFRFYQSNKKRKETTLFEKSLFENKNESFNLTQRVVKWLKKLNRL